MNNNVKKTNTDRSRNSLSLGQSSTRIKTKPLDIESWAAKSLWRKRDIPFLFLGIEPENKEMLSSRAKILRRQYFDLIENAIAKDELEYFEGMPDIAFEPAAVISWRKKVKMISPATDYLKLESHLQSVGKKSQKEEACQAWLEELMGKNSIQGKTKSGYQADARDKFNVGATLFNRAWTNAIEQSGNINWGKRGRKKN